MVRDNTLALKRDTLVARARTHQAIRNFFVAEGYLEVDTPLRIPSPLPEAHIDAIPSPPWHLQTSPEPCMKRLLAAGYDRIFQICHCWRYEERGRRHLPEFTMLEWYRSYCDYRALMSECERLFSSLADILGSGNALQYQGTAISLAPPWQRLTVREAFRLYGGIPMEKALSQGLFDEVMSFAIEPRLGWVTPTFLHDYPAELGALARLKPDDPSVAERFELYLGGMEIANAFSELTDQDEQRQRFMAENALRQAAGKQCYPLPEKFLAALADLPPSAGIALGVDRLIMLFLDKTEISSVIAFSPEDL